LILKIEKFVEFIYLKLFRIFSILSDIKSKDLEDELFLMMNIKGHLKDFINWNVLIKGTW